MIVITDGMTHAQELSLLWSLLWPYLLVLAFMVPVQRKLRRWGR